MYKLLVLCLAVAFASASFAVLAPSDVITRDDGTCLASNKINLVTMEGMDKSGNANPNFLINYVHLVLAKITQVNALVYATDAVVAEDFCSHVVNVLPTSFKERVWLSVNADNSLWTLDVSQRLAYLGTIVSTCTQHGLNLGISSDKESWAAVFGSSDASLDALKSLPLRYISQDGNSNFNDYPSVKFGGWLNPTMKQYLTNESFCNHNMSFDFY